MSLFVLKSLCFLEYSVFKRARCEGVLAVLGAVAQLGEHLLCKQGVVGSIPSGSTIWFIIIVKRIVIARDEVISLPVLLKS